MRPLPLALLALLVPGLAAAETRRELRAVVTDHAAATVAVLDVARGEVLARFPTTAPARVARAGQFGEVALVQGAAGEVAWLSTGLRLEPHGDHQDLRVGPPRLTGQKLTGPRPSHLNQGEGRTAAFFDGDGRAVLVGPGLEAPRILETGRPHHGVAVPLPGGRTAISLPGAADGDPPVGLAVVDAAGQPLARAETCPRLHGEGRTGATLAFGCADGVLLLDMRQIAFRHLPAPAEAGGRMVRNLVGGADFRLLFGDFGADAMVVIDPDSGRFEQVALPARRLHFAMDPADAAQGFVLTEDGTIHRINTLAARIEASAPAVRRYSLEGGAAVARPRISVAGGRVLVSDPTAGRLLVLEAATLAPIRSIALGGAPFDVLAVAATGETH